MDIKNINPPDFTQCMEHGKDYFIFSEFLKPGYHQILIYDPKYNRAYCKDFVVNMNLREDIYPEYPMQPNTKGTKKIANVWRKWFDDSQEDIFKAF